MTVFTGNSRLKNSGFTKTAERNSPKRNVKGLYRNRAAYYFRGLHVRGFGVFMCMWGESHALCLFFMLSVQRKVQTKAKRQMYGYWSSFVLYPPEAFTVKDVWVCTLFPEQLSASYWQLAYGEYPLPGSLHSVCKDAFTLHMCHSKLETRKALMLCKYFQRSLCEVVFAAEILDP